MMLNKANALEKLRRQQAVIDQLLPSESSPEFTKWKRDTEVAIRNVFGQKVGHLSEFGAINYGLLVWGSGTPDSAWVDACRSGLEHAKVMLQSMIDEVEEYWAADRFVDDGPSNDVTVVVTRSKPEPGAIHSRDVFVVHGHDETMKQSVCRTLEKLGLNPIVLHEKPNRGRTIIEKFTDYSAVGFAVILLSPDDVGCERDKAASDLHPRPRRNVVLELGLFLGKLGRDRVMPLCQQVPNFDLPSDYSGVVYTSFDGAGHWRFDLVKELNAAGYSVDANKLLS
jgi:hypothetical protein